MSDTSGQNQQQEQQQAEGKPAAQGGYTPPQSQEELDRLVQSRVARAKESAAAEARKEFEGWVPKDKAAELEEKLSKAEGELNGVYRREAATQAGLPESMADRLAGNDREAWQSDAQALAASLLGKATGQQSQASDKEVGVEVASTPPNPRQRPGERRGDGGGRVDYADVDVQEVVKNIPRF